jgi:carboxyl-terminal processing protease
VPATVARGATAQAGSTAEAVAPVDLEAELDWIWEVLRTQFYDSTLVERWFTEKHRASLTERARAARNLDELARAVNALLDSIDLSHLGVYTRSDIEYDLFESMFVTGDMNVPRVHHLGLQVDRAGSAQVVRAVWDGLSADRAGLRRGDVIVSADGRPFHPVLSFTSGDRATLVVVRGGAPFHVDVTPTYEGVNASLLRAMGNSARRLNVDGHVVGFVHLWSGTCPEMLEALSDIVLGTFRDVDGIILDLRDGWGGAWYEYLDLFFADRSEYYEVTIERRGRRTTVQPEPIEPHPWFARPLVVLINEGTRSGKEALAFQFKKSKRAVLVGTTTAGAFTGGTCRFGNGYVVFLPSNGPILLDGQTVEGVAPDVRVDDPLDRPSKDDPQLECGIREMRALLDR